MADIPAALVKQAAQQVEPTLFMPWEQRQRIARAVLAAVWSDVGAAYERGFSDGEDSALRFNPPEVGDRHG